LWPQGKFGAELFDQTFGLAHRHFPGGNLVDRHDLGGVER